MNSISFIPGKTNLMYYLWLGLFLCFGSFSCHSTHQDKAKEKKDTLNGSYRDSASLELHKDDRTIWQKPYEIINLLGSLEGKVIADIGAGSGYFSYRFIHTARKVIAIDIEPQLIAMIDQEKMYYKPEIQSKLEARLATPDNPMLERNEVDIVFLSNTYVFIEDRVNYLRNLRNKFRADGRIMIVDFKKKLTQIGPEQKYRLAESDVEQELINAGYEIILSDDELLDYQYVIIAKPKLF